MALTENFAAFFADFGVTAQLGALSAQVILDAPDANVLGDRVQSTTYEIRYLATDFPALKHGDPMTVDGTDYMVHSVGNIDDGVMRTAILERVRS